MQRGTVEWFVQSKEPGKWLPAYDWQARMIKKWMTAQMQRGVTIKNHKRYNETMQTKEYTISHGDYGLMLEFMHNGTEYVIAKGNCRTKQSIGLPEGKGCFILNRRTGMARMVKSGKAYYHGIRIHHKGAATIMRCDVCGKRTIL